MNIAVNTRLLLKDKLEGIGWFSYETLKRITQNHPEHTYYFIFDRPYHNEFVFSDNVVPLVAGPPTRHPFLWVFWMEFVIPRLLKKIKADYFVSPDGYLSLRSKIPQVTVIHDINFVHNPLQMPFWVRKYNNFFFPRFAKKALSIGTVSEYSKNDISKTFGVEPSKIHVCYNGSNSVYKPLSEAEKIKVKSEFTNGEDFFIFIGALNPRKNIPGLLKSFEIFKNSGNYTQKLVIVGSAMHLTQEIDLTLKTLKHKQDIIFTGRLDVKTLHEVLASSIALVYVPFFEGFGIPLVEAMYAETAIISGNETSLPEVVGDAALMCSPIDHSKVAEYMSMLIQNPDLRMSLIDKGRKQRVNFSWDKSADRFWTCIETAINMQKC